MDIPEIQVGGVSGKRKKYSLKVKVAAKEYLAAKGLAIEDLTDSQQDYVYKYIKSKRCVKWSVAFAVIMSGVFALLCFYGYTNILKMVVEEFAPEFHTYGNETGVSTTVTISNDEWVKDYGFACAAMGALIGGLIFQCFSTLGIAIGSWFQLRGTGLMLGAFLPCCSKANPSCEENIRTECR